MLTAPRILVIDDEIIHAKGLAECLNEQGAACLPIHFTGDPKEIKECPDVRIIFADLNLLGLKTGSKIDFSTIGGLLEESIKPVGPYFIILWTMFPEEATALFDYLEEQLISTTPIDVRPLDKNDHLNEKGHVKDTSALIREIKNISEEMPELSALLDWEQHVTRATGATLSSLLEILAEYDRNERPNLLGRVLAQLGIASAGEFHFQRDFFRSVNEALLPILEDRIANLRKDDSGSKLWQQPLGESTDHVIPCEIVARLNHMVIFAEFESSREYERGSVVLLVESIKESFCQQFGVDEENTARDQFRCKNFQLSNDDFRWVLVQVQAACDYAQGHPGLLPCYLGLEFPAKCLRAGTLPQSIWATPVFEMDGSSRRLHVNGRFPVSLSRSTFKSASPIYRLRDQVVNALAHKLHSHGSRPGMLSFRNK